MAEAGGDRGRAVAVALDPAGAADADCEAPGAILGRLPKSAFCQAPHPPVCSAAFGEVAERLKALPC